MKFTCLKRGILFYDSSVVSGGRVSVPYETRNSIFNKENNLFFFQFPDDRPAFSFYNFNWVEHIIRSKCMCNIYVAFSYNPMQKNPVSAM